MLFCYVHTNPYLLCIDHCCITPPQVEIQQERIEFINDKVVNKVEDEGFGEEGREMDEDSDDDDEDEVS